MDLIIDQTALKEASADLETKCQELSDLKKTIEASFAQLEAEWDSDAGKAFFKTFKNDLLSNLEKYSLVFNYMSANLSTSLQKYEEVFRAADTVANVQY